MISIQTTLGVVQLTPAEVLSTLFNRSQIRGMGFMDPNSNKNNLTVEEAQALIPSRGHAAFDYLYGRCLKIDLTNGTMLETRLYNRDFGTNAAEDAVLDFVTSKR